MLWAQNGEIMSSLFIPQVFLLLPLWWFKGQRWRRPDQRRHLLLLSRRGLDVEKFWMFDRWRSFASWRPLKSADLPRRRWTSRSWSVVSWPASAAAFQKCPCLPSACCGCDATSLPSAWKMTSSGWVDLLLHTLLKHLLDLCDLFEVFVCVWGRRWAARWRSPPSASASSWISWLTSSPSTMAPLTWAIRWVF